jgi:hypothetical protein
MTDTILPSQYDLFQIKKINPENFPDFFEKLFKFKADKLDFVQHDLKKGFHFRYLTNYLHYDERGLGANTVVVEKEYTCLTFLEDYVNYYAHCYTKYDKKCKRIHFFKESFDNCTFQNMLLLVKDDEKNKEQYVKNWESYLGCIVVKPLPKGIIGVTFLKTYDGDSDKDRYYTATSIQTINLYGRSI